jgi:hypothetical protein
MFSGRSEMQQKLHAFDDIVVFFARVLLRCTRIVSARVVVAFLVFLLSFQVSYDELFAQ